MEILENPTSFRPEPQPTETSEEYFEIQARYYKSSYVFDFGKV